MPSNVFYVSEMNATNATDTAATFRPPIAGDPTVTNPNISTIAGLSAANASLAFSFYLDNVPDTPAFVGATNGNAANFPSLVTAAENNSQSEIDLKNCQADFVEELAKKIFGSVGATSLFTNRSAVNTGYNLAVSSNATATNNILGANEVTKVAASNTLVQQLSVNYSERFALAYKAESVAVGSTVNGQAATALYISGETTVDELVVYRNNSLVTSGITQPKVVVSMSNNSGTINTIYVKEHPTQQFTSETGSGFALGDTVAFKYTDTNSNICLLQIPSLNPVQVAMLNGKLDNNVLLGLTKAASLFTTDLNVGDGTNGVASLSGNFTSANNISSTVVSGTQINGSGATFDVVMNSDATAVSSIKINTTGSNYVENNLVRLSQGLSTIDMTLSAAMVNVLNGADNAGYGTFACPVGTDGKTGGISVIGGSGTGATVDVTMSNATTIEKIVLNTSGSDYKNNDNITLSAGTPQQRIDITLTTETATLLNGDGYSLITPTNIPLEAGDRIQKVDSVTSSSGQLNTKGELVSLTQTTKTQYLLS